MPDHYTIRLRGHLDRRWADWFDGLVLTIEADGTTLLTGPLADQAALHGVLSTLYELGLPLVLVECAAIDESCDASPSSSRT